MTEPVVTPFGLFETPYLRFEHDSLPAIDSARIWADPRIKDLFFADDAKAVLVMLTAEPGLSKEKCDRLLDHALQVTEQSGFPDAHMAGRIVGHRREHGPFSGVDELLAVRGIGPRSFERLRPLVTASRAGRTRPADSLQIARPRSR